MEKKTLVLASNNAHKLEEIRAVLGSMYDIKGLKDIGCHDDIPETGDTFEANALQKALYVKEHFGVDCFADDSGLQVEALNGEPGVYSARYAAKNGKSVGDNKDDANMDALLEKLNAIPPVSITEGPLAGSEGWKACFRTCIALVQEEEKYYFD